MRFSRTLNVVDAHAESESGKVVIGGVGPVPGLTMFDKKVYFKEHLDQLANCSARVVAGTASGSGSGAPEDCGSEDVFVVGVRETVWAFQSLPSDHQGVTENGTHLVGEVAPSRGRFPRCLRAYQFELFVDFDFF
jgi:hypothetical protein